MYMKLNTVHVCIGPHLTIVRMLHDFEIINVELCRDAGVH